MGYIDDMVPPPIEAPEGMVETGSPWYDGKTFVRHFVARELVEGSTIIRGIM